MMVVLGVDAHKRTHTIVAVDETGRQVGSVTVTANTDGHLRALRWAAGWERRRWAVEDCRHVTRRLEADLLVAGESVVRVPTRLMSEVRSTVREPGKSDPIDALATARAALREPGLAVAELDGPAREVRMLVDYREQLVRERTRLQSRLRWYLHELDPDYQPASLSRVTTLDRVAAWVAARDGLVAMLCAETVARIRDITLTADRLEAQIAERVNQLAPSLLELPGCGPLTAGKLIGEIGNPARFRNKDAFAAFAGTAPIPVSSGNRHVYRLNRGGNRQVNAALHRIAVTQARYHPPAIAIINRHHTGNGRKKHAYRVLKRRLANVVYRTLLADLTQPTSQAA